MRHWIHPAAVTVVFIAGLAFIPVAAQQETVDLRLRLSRGETLYYADAGSFQFSVENEARATRTNVEQRYEGRQAVRVLDVDATGVMLVEFVVEDLRLTAGRQTEEVIDAPWTFKVRPDGRIAETVSGPPSLEDFPYALPGRPVRVGESWSRQVRFTQYGLLGQGTGTFTLERQDRAADGRVAVVRVATEATITGTAAGGSSARASGTVRMTGEYHWSIDRGRVIRSSSEVAGNVEGTATVEGQMSRVRTTLGGATRQEALAAERVMPPAVASDLLISPGRGIGAFSLSLTLPELTSRLGTPQPVPDLGFASPALAWRNGLVGYVDSADRTKLVALDTGEPGYRTDKGIGFGSSEGAVLMAYGFSPVRVQIHIPQLGGARVLIYNDLGIAFGITSDAQHADAGPDHAPIGAVDWITVFPPGGAGRVYRIP